MDDSLGIDKSTRHSKIIGLFGEAFLCNWLSRSGFEVIVVDHTGLDIIAYQKTTGRRLGITVKSRTRAIGKEAESVNIFSNKKPHDDRCKLLEACQTFACEPWIAVYVETVSTADLYLTSLENFDRRYRPNPSGAIDQWRMGIKQKLAYDEDQGVCHISVEFIRRNWPFDNRGEAEGRSPNQV